MPLASTDGPAAQPRLSPPISPTAAAQAQAGDLRRLTSSGNLAPARDARGRSPRNSVHGGHLGIATARGTLSPATSIPSSPTSVHSTSSAIFERDVEPILTHSLSLSPSSDGLPIQPATPVNQHLIPRQKAHEAIDQSVPSVLDSAAAILATTDGHDLIADQVAIVSPAAPSIASSLFATTSSSPLRSRSPSPAMSSSLSASMFGANRAGSVSPPMRPTLSSEVTAMQVPRSMSINSTTSDDSRLLSAPASPSVPLSALDHTTPVPGGAFALPSKSSPPLSPEGGAPVTTTTTAGIPIPRARAPPSPSKAAARLSFISYSDLVSSVPSSTQALSSLTSGASADAPPPHLPSVSLPGEGGSTASSIRNVSGGSHFLGGHGMTGAGSSHAARGQRESAILLNDEGGEWEREGLGMGLEERLEAIAGIGRQAPVSGTA